MLETSRKLRKAATDAENHLWRYLRNRKFCGIKFKRQFIFKNYIVDMVCLEYKLIIEIDGSQHVELENHDEERTQFLESFGFKVIRFWNHEVFNNTKQVLEKVYRVLEERGAFCRIG